EYRSPPSVSASLPASAMCRCRPCRPPASSHCQTSARFLLDGFDGNTILGQARHSDSRITAGENDQKLATRFTTNTAATTGEDRIVDTRFTRDAAQLWLIGRSTPEGQSRHLSAHRGHGGIKTVIVLGQHGLRNGMG